jgi:hypothetical protein
LYGRKDAFALGGRVIYLSPERLLAGGAIGGRLVGEADRARLRRDRPWFLDAELGVLAELDAGNAARITDNVAFMASAGVGQELGDGGGGLFWKLGGFVIVGSEDVAGDRPVAGGATLGIGARY